VLHYLVRVIAEGDTVAPPAKIEAMYEPSKHGLSPTQRVITLPSGQAKVVER
jgi:alpha-2-macroglobulin